MNFMEYPLLPCCNKIFVTDYDDILGLQEVIVSSFFPTLSCSDISYIIWTISRGGGLGPKFLVCSTTVHLCNKFSFSLGAVWLSDCEANSI